MNGSGLNPRPRTTSSIPAAANILTKFSTMGRCPTGNIGLGVVNVSGRKRVPNPPTSTTARISQQSWSVQPEQLLLQPWLSKNLAQSLRQAPWSHQQRLSLIHLELLKHQRLSMWSDQSCRRQLRRVRAKMRPKVAIQACCRPEQKLQKRPCRLASDEHHQNS